MLKMRKMKASGIEWIGEIPEGWEVVPVKRLCTMQAGKNLTSEQIAPEGTYPVYGGNGIRGFFSDYNCDGQFLTVGRQGALCGNVHKINGKVWATEHAVITTPSSYTTLDFLYYLLIGMDLNQYVSSTAAQPGLAVGTLLNLKTCYPCSTLEQTQISNYLNAKCSEIDDLLTSVRSSIEEYKKLKQTVITQAVTKGVRGEREMKDSGVEWIGEIPAEWKICPLKRLASIQTGSTPSKNSSEKFYSTNGIPWIKPNNLGFSYSIEKTAEFISLDANSNAHIMPPKTVYIGCIGSRIGNSGYSLISCSCNQQINALIFNQHMFWKYGWYLTISQEPQYMLLANGNVIHIINSTTQGNISCVVPALVEQKEIADYLDAKYAEIDKLIAKKEQLIKELESYKKSLIYEVVTGKREV